MASEAGNVPASFSKEQTAFICNAYGLGGLSSIALLQQGENHHYICKGLKNDYFLRVSRRSEAAANTLLSELAWIEALGNDISVPKIIHTRSGQPCLPITLEGEDTFIVIFDLLYGYHLTEPTEGDWEVYGRTLRRLHDASRQVLARKDERWIGRRRKRFSVEEFVSQSARSILEADWIDRDLAQSFNEEAANLTLQIERQNLEQDFGSFIHFDLHLGNLLLTPDTPVVLDFEECCFGPRAIDLGVIRLHARSENRLNKAWAPFVKGYDDDEIAAAAPLGAAIKALYLAGKIPHRLDVPDVAKNPAGILEHLLTNIRQECQAAETARPATF